MTTQPQSGSPITYHYIINKSPEGGYTGQCLELAGAISEGETEEELAKNMAEAIQLVIEYTHERALAKNEMIKTIEISNIS